MISYTKHVLETNLSKASRALRPYSSSRLSIFSLRTADAFPVVASLPPNEATTGNASAQCSHANLFSKWTIWKTPPSILNHQQLTDPTPVSLHFKQAGYFINDVILIPLELIRSNRDAVRNGLISSPLIWYPLISKTNNNPSLLLSHFQIRIWNELLALFSFFF